MPGPPAADRNIWYTTLKRSPQCRSGPVEVPRRREALSDQTSLRSAHKTTPTLHVTKTSTAAVPNRRSVTWEGRTGWEDRYINIHRGRRRVRFGGNSSASTCCVHLVFIIRKTICTCSFVWYVFHTFM